MKTKEEIKECNECKTTFTDESKLIVCERCNNDFCENCQAEYNQFTQIDYNCCKSCGKHDDRDNE